MEWMSAPAEFDQPRVVVHDDDLGAPSGLRFEFEAAFDQPSSQGGRGVSAVCTLTGAIRDADGGWVYRRHRAMVTTRGYANNDLTLAEIM
ncbi:hypothetical protein EEB13_07860 [Rhodococcus sp. WS3]|nr:hypothetical protein EEB13_07860 [Rhodococcus sp. WS3]